MEVNTPPPPSVGRNVFTKPEALPYVQVASAKLGRFEAFGPFNVPVDNAGRPSEDSESIAEFWREVEWRKDGLSNGCGCFVFSVLNCVSVPMSVGIAVESGFRHMLSCGNFTNRALAAHTVQPVGTMHVHLIAKLTPMGQTARPSARHRSDIIWLERFVVAFASRQNANLITSRPALAARLALTAEAILGPAEYSNLDQRAFRRLLGF